MTDKTRDDIPRRFRWVVPLVAEAVAWAAVAVAGGLSSWGLLEQFGNTTDTRFGVVMFPFRAPIMIAAGHGMRDIDTGRFPNLHDFYSLRTPDFDLSEIPEDYAGSPVSNSYCLMHYHLMRAMGLVWRVLGVSRRSLNVLAMLLFVLLMAAFHGLFRLAMGRALALGFVVWLSVSPALLLVCPSIRDFSKAPFLIAAVAALGYLVHHEHSRRVFLAGAAVAGMITGIGFGFRQDVGLAVPLAMAVLVGLAPVPGKKKGLLRLASVVLFLGAFVVLGWKPIQGTRLDNGSASAQAFVQGVSRNAESRLDFGQASYIHHYSMSDPTDFSVINTYARRTGNTDPMPGHFCPAYGKAGHELAQEYWTNWTGDMVARALAALWALPQTAALARHKNILWAFHHNGGARQVLEARSMWHDSFARFALIGTWPLVVVALALLFVSNPRLALFFGVLFGFFGAYPGLLYDFRHVFHLAFVPYWALGVVLSQGILLIRKARKESGYARMAMRRVGGFAAIAIGAGIVLLGLQTVTRVWQDARMNALVDAYTEAALDVVPFRTIENSGGTLIQPAAPLPNLEQAPALGPAGAVGEYLVLEFDSPSQPVSLRIVYDQDRTDFTREIALPAVRSGADGTFRFFFPVYEVSLWCPESHNHKPGERCRMGQFAGIEVQQEVLESIRGLYRVRDSADFRIWPYIVLPREKADFIPHKTGPLDRWLP